MENNWIGHWKNQYGSQLIIDRAENGEIGGSFKSAVNQSIPASKVSGIYTGNLIVVSVPSRKEGEKVASWTRILQDGRIETMWHVAIGGKGIWEAFLTGADSFDRSE